MPKIEIFRFILLLFNSLISSSFSLPKKTIKNNLPLSNSIRPKHIKWSSQIQSHIYHKTLIKLIFGESEIQTKIKLTAFWRTKQKFSWITDKRITEIPKKTKYDDIFFATQQWTMTQSRIVHANYLSSYVWRLSRYSQKKITKILILLVRLYIKISIFKTFWSVFVWFKKI